MWRAESNDLNCFFFQTYQLAAFSNLQEEEGKVWILLLTVNKSNATGENARPLEMALPWAHCICASLKLERNNFLNIKKLKKMEVNGEVMSFGEETRW